jgi:ergothioneine biosynthesis protein EgtB
MMPTATHISLRSRYTQIRQQSEQLCAPLATEDYVVQPIPDVSPPKWHLGHTTWFFENFLLVPYLKGYTVFNPKYPYFFNSYYESQGPRVHRSHRGNMTRPSVEDIYQFRKHVDRHLLDLIDQLENSSEAWADEARFTLEIGLQHEQQHQELLVTDIKYILGNNPLFPAYDSHEPTRAEVIRLAKWIEMDAGLYTIGHSGDDFCWDNELSAHQVYLQEYAVQDRLVTNGEYLEFMQVGGYENYDHWLAEGWDWAKQLESKSPLYWYQQEGQWFNYTLQGLRPVDLHQPVTHVSYFEADAFARDAMGGTGPMIGALRKLAQKNLSNLTPHPLYSGFYYSHPTLLERERALAG